MKYLKIAEKSEDKNLLSIAIELDDVEQQMILSDILKKKVNREKAEEGFLMSIQRILDRYWMEKRESIKQKIQNANLEETEVLELVKKFDSIKNQRPEILFPEN